MHPHSSGVRRQSRRNAVRDRAATHRVETLEGRRLLASVVGTVLNLNGGSGNDAFTITKSGTNLRVVENGGTAQTFAIASVTLINVSLAGGNDTLNIANNILISASVQGGAGDDGIITGGGNDTIDGGTGNDYVDGRDGSDTVSYASSQYPISGYNRANISPGVNGYTFALAGQAGPQGETDNFINVEALAGGSGNDTLDVGAGFYGDDPALAPAISKLEVDGNGGDDLLTVGNSYTDGISLSNGFPLVVASGGEGNDHLRYNSTTESAATLYGGAGDDFFEQVGTDDFATIVPGDGIDSLEFNNFDRRDRPYYLPAGLEDLTITGGLTSVYGNDLDNVIHGTPGFVDGGGGNDLIALDTAATILGGTGNDTIIAGSGIGSNISGGDGDDNLLGSYYADTLDGGIGNDTLNGFGGNDLVTGGDGDDVFYDVDYQYGTVQFDGGIGSNRIVVDNEFFASDHTYAITATRVSRTLTSSANLERAINFTHVNAVSLTADNGNDTIAVSSLPAAIVAVTIDSGGGNDAITVFNSVCAFSINTGSGSNTVSLANSTPDTSLFAVKGGGDDDRLFVSGALPPSITFDGGAGNNALTVDSTGSALQNYSLSTQTLTRLQTPGGTNLAYPFYLQFSNVPAITLLTGSANDTITVDSAAAFQHVVINTGDGVDTLVVNRTGTFSTLNFVSGDGDDVLNVGVSPATVATVQLQQAETLGPLTVNGGGKVVLAPSDTEANVLRVKSLNITGVGTVDITNNPFIIDYDGPSPLVDITARIRQARNGGAVGAWTGGGVTSSLASMTPGTAVGVADSTELFGIFPAIFAGQSVDATSVLVRYTRAGDLNLDRVVDFNDLVVLSQNYGQATAATYAHGNLDYSVGDAVNFNDLVLLSQNYGQSLASITLPPATGTKKTAPARIAAIL